MMNIDKDLLIKAAREIIKKEKTNYYSNLYTPNTLKEEEKDLIKKLYDGVNKNENK